MLRIKNRFLLITITLLFSIVSFSQNYINPLEYSNVPTPEASSLGRYSDVPVSYSTGVPNIQIPPKQELEIDYTKTTSGLIGFTITTNNGNKYVFGALEGESFADTKTETSQAIDLGVHEEYVTGWFLRKVVTPSG